MLLRSKTNRLTLDLGHFAENGLTLLLYIDGVEFRRILFDESNAAVFPNLLESLKRSGDYLIFTCSCGIADCGGWEKIKVVHNNNMVTWTFNYARQEHIYKFKLDNYKTEIQRIQKRIESEKLELEPKNVIGPE
ncbi:MAG: hypothetical protein K0S32_3857 [Bacteroidetes bacterium]|jgi:hypothetical protein|nr:hypothetical protein [Bacteroidota bacterium]